MRQGLILGVTVCCSGCVLQTAPWPQYCPPQAPKGAVGVRADSVGHLAGRYLLTQVWLSFDPYTRTEEYDITLAPNDSLPRYYINTGLGWQRQGNRPLAGRSRLIKPPPPPDYRNRTDTLTLEAGILYVGCHHGCNDGSPDEFKLMAQTGDMVWGLWHNAQTGLGRLLTRDRKEAPDPAGYFCARRQP